MCIFSTSIKLFSFNILYIKHHFFDTLPFSNQFTGAHKQIVSQLSTEKGLVRTQKTTPKFFVKVIAASFPCN